MTMLILLVALALSPSAMLASIHGQSLSQKREGLRPEVAITTLPAVEYEKHLAAKTFEHDSEVARNEVVMVVVTVQGCEADAKGACNASADIVAYKPDGSVHSEMKNVAIAKTWGTVPLKLAANDALGVYKVVATVRDLNARRFGTTERLFGVK